MKRGPHILIDPPDGYWQAQAEHYRHLFRLMLALWVPFAFTLGLIAGNLLYTYIQL